jgi:mannose-6-phosphate isomerase-like protein (cupin superfamily)
MTMNINEQFENGTIATLPSLTQTQSIDFIPHPKFKGVAMKHLVTGSMTENQISCHLVKVDPFCTLDTHTHETNLEIHEIISGDGTCNLADKKIAYAPGTLTVIPPSTFHKVEAGRNGLYILAKFTPALL